MEMGCVLAISINGNGTSAHIDQTNTAIALRGHKLFRENLRRYTHARSSFALPRSFHSAPSPLESSMRSFLRANQDVSRVTLCVEKDNKDAQDVSHVQTMRIMSHA